MNFILFTMNNPNNNLSVQIYNQVGESLTIFNTNSILDLPESSYAATNIQTNVLPDGSHVDAKVQTKSLWKLFKKTLKKLICINDSDITPQDVINESNVQELVEAYDIGQAFSQTNAIFDYKFIDGIHQYFISYSDTILSVNPDLINYFIF